MKFKDDLRHAISLFPKKPLIILNKNIIPFTYTSYLPDYYILINPLSTTMVKWVFFFVKATGLYSKKIGKN